MTHEGEAIKRLLKDKGYSIQDLARAAGVKWPSAARYVRAERLGAKARESCTRGLLALGLDPRQIWTWASAAQSIEDLKALVLHFKGPQLQALRTLLLAEKADQGRLVDFIDGLLEAHR